MSRIRGKDTIIEKAVRSFLFAKGLRFRKNDRRYPGHPDVVLPKYHTVVFVNGCFWHMHDDCPKAARIPKSNVEFWTAKLTRNRERDARQHAELETMGWKVIVVWECELGKKAREERLERLYAQIVDESEDGAVAKSVADSADESAGESVREPAAKTSESVPGKTAREQMPSDVTRNVVEP